MEIGETTKLPSFSDEGFGVGKIELHGNVVEIHVGGNWREGREGILRGAEGLEWK